MGHLEILSGGAWAQGGFPNGALYGDALEDARFEGVALERWMWSGEGLGLRPGVDLMVYAVVYAASCGGGLLASSCSALAAELGCARETVTRSLSRLSADCLVWSPTEVRSRDGGRPVKCYRCCEGPLGGSGVPESARLRVRGGAGSPCAPCASSGADEAAGPVAPQRDAGAPNPCGGFQQCGGARHETLGLREAGSPSEGDGGARSEGGSTSPNPIAHVGENGALPAETRVFDTAHISTYNLQKGSEVTSLESGGGTCQQPSAGAVEAALRAEAAVLAARGEDPVLEGDLAAFSALVGMSLLPVDEAYLAQCLAAFCRLVGAGVTADVVLAAYGSYASYWRERRRKCGEWRPMHLLNWLRQRPNEQIRREVAERDERWRRALGQARRKVRVLPTH